MVYEAQLEHCTLTAFGDHAVRGVFKDRTLVTLHPQQQPQQPPDSANNTAAPASVHNCRVVTPDGDELFLCYPSDKSSGSRSRSKDAATVAAAAAAKHEIDLGYSRHLRLVHRFSKWVFATEEQQAEANFHRQVQAAACSKCDGHDI